MASMYLSVVVTAFPHEDCFDLACRFASFSLIICYLLQVAWKEESNPSLGFDYLYLSEEDYHALPKGTVDAVAVMDMRSGETRWQLEAIIGQTHGIGVENLR